jgi:hypothetical protein
MTQYPSFGSSHIDQPKDRGVMNDREIEAQRIRVLESAKFAEWLEERMADRGVHADVDPAGTFSRSEIGIIGYYVGMADKDALYRYLKELMGGEIENIVRKLEE